MLVLAALLSEGNYSPARQVRQASGTWTPEFRRWLDAYLYDGLDDARLLADLHDAAVEAGERARRDADALREWRDGLLDDLRVLQRGG